MLFAGKAWFGLIEARFRVYALGFIEEVLEQELKAAFDHTRGELKDYRNGTRRRLGSFDAAENCLLQGRMATECAVSQESRYRNRIGR